MRNKLNIPIYKFIKYQNKIHWSVNSIYNEYVDEGSICISRIIDFDTYGFGLIKTFNI